MGRSYYVFIFSQSFLLPVTACSLAKLSFSYESDHRHFENSLQATDAVNTVETMCYCDQILRQNGTIPDLHFRCGISFLLRIPPSTSLL